MKQIYLVNCENYEGVLVNLRRWDSNVLVIESNRQTLAFCQRGTFVVPPYVCKNVTHDLYII